MNTAELITYIKTNPTTNKCHDLIRMLEAGDLTGAANWTMSHGLGGLWMKVREAAGLPCSAEDCMDEGAKIAAARKARYAGRR